MAYKIKQQGVIRDECYVGEIAGSRPALVTRMHWEDNAQADGQDANQGRGGDRVALFNRQLREGHAGRNHGEE